MSAIPGTLDDTLLHLAKVLFPLDAWLNIADKYQPPNAAKLPWRAEGKTLSLDALKVIGRFKQLVEADPLEEELRRRWNKITAAPRWLETDLPYQADWRTNRKLDDVAIFAPVDSDNFTISTDDPKTRAKRPRARPEFYAACASLLLKATQQYVFVDAASWIDFVKNLFNDALSAWPPGELVKSSDFIRRFAKDIAICLLDQENALLANTPDGDLWRRAVLIEAGEHRFTGNAYSVEDVGSARKAFDQALSKALAGNQP